MESLNPALSCCEKNQGLIARVKTGRPLYDRASKDVGHNDIYASTLLNTLQLLTYPTKTQFKQYICSVRTLWVMWHCVTWQQTPAISSCTHAVAYLKALMLSWTWECWLVPRRCKNLPHLNIQLIWFLSEYSILNRGFSFLDYFSDREMCISCIVLRCLPCCVTLFYHSWRHR